MNKHIKKYLPVILAVVTIIGIGVKYSYSLKNKEVYAETFFKGRMETETDELEEILSVDSSELELNENLSSDDNNVFEDTNNNLYTVQDDEVTGFFSSQDNIESMELSETQIKKMALEYLKTMTDNSDNYVLDEEKYNEDVETYRFYFYHYLGEYKTADVVYIEIDKCGNVKAFAKPFEGLFDNIDYELLPEDTVIEKAVALSYYNGDNYSVSVSEIILERDDNIKYRVSLDCVDNKDGTVYTDTVYID